MAVDKNYFDQLESSMISSRNESVDAVVERKLNPQYNQDLDDALNYVNSKLDEKDWTMFFSDVEDAAAFYLEQYQKKRLKPDSPSL